MTSDKLELARTVLEEFYATQRASDWFADDVVFDFSEFRGWIEESEYHGRNGFDEQLERWLTILDLARMHLGSRARLNATVDFRMMNVLL